MSRKLFALILVGGVICLCNLAFGESEKEKIFKGFSFSGGQTFVFQGIINTGSEDVNRASFSMDLEIEREFSDYGKGYLHFEAGKGGGVTDKLEVFGNVNADATGDKNFDLIEAWYEHRFKNIPLTITFGKIDPTRYIDANEYANDETMQFLGDIFTNSPAVEFPDYAGGIRLAIEPANSLCVELVTADADADWGKIFDNVFWAGQLNFKPNFLGRPGNYRLYGWFNNLNHIKWQDPLKTKEKSHGFGLSLDQEITDALGAFARYGWQNPQNYAEGTDFSLGQTWSIGFQVKGSLWKRGDDILGIAFGQIIPSDDYRKVKDLKAKTESHLEAYYNFKVNDSFVLSLDIQIIWNPYGTDGIHGDRTILVGGIRAQVNF